jgi:hypothetical protein
MSANVESLEEMEQMAKDAFKLLKDLSDVPLPKTPFEAVTSEFMTDGVKGFADWTNHHDPAELKRWHQRCVTADVALACLDRIQSVALAHFGDNTLSKLSQILAAPLQQLEFITGNLGLFAEILFRIEDVFLQALKRALITLHAEGRFADIAESVLEALILFLVDLLEGEDDEDEEADSNWQPILDALERAGGTLSQWKDQLVNDVKAIISPVMLRMAYEVAYELLIVYVSVEAAHKVYLPMHKARDESIRYVNEKTLDNESKRFREMTPKMRTAWTKLKGFVKGKLPIPTLPGEGVRFGRRKRSSRGSQKFKNLAEDLIFSRHRGRRTKLEEELRAVVDAVQKWEAWQKRKRNQLKRIANLQAEIAKLPDEMLDGLSKGERAAKQQLKRRYKRALKAAQAVLKGEVYEMRSDAASEMRAKRDFVRHWFPQLPSALGR